MPETAVGLQTQLNRLHHAASELDFKVTMNKSNIIVFRTGGCLGARERWVHCGAVRAVVMCTDVLVFTSLHNIFSFLFVKTWHVELYMPCSVFCKG